MQSCCLVLRLGLPAERLRSNSTIKCLGLHYFIDFLLQHKTGLRFEPRTAANLAEFKTQGHTDWTKGARMKAGVVPKPLCCDPEPSSSQAALPGQKECE